jgi:hypothetical protein
MRCIAGRDRQRTVNPADRVAASKQQRRRYATATAGSHPPGSIAVPRRNAMNYRTTDTMLRLTAFAMAGVATVALVATIAAGMPPLETAIRVARDRAPESRVEVAIVPSRIEVIGVREAPATAQADDADAKPRS